MNAIELSHINKRFGSFAIRDLSLAVPQGTICGLVGENGAGKSTTIRLLMGALRPDSGAASVLGTDVSAPAFRAVKEDIGVVMDEAYFPEVLSARQVGRVMAKTYRCWNDQTYQDFLRRFDLPEKKQFKDYSRGMRMKLAIAVALSHDPKLLVLDEATAGLDPVVRDEILDTFLAFVCDEDHAVLMSSHITSDLEKAADYIAYLHRGQLLFCEEKDRLLERCGRLVCGAADLEGVDRALLAGVRRGRFSCEALVRDRAEFRRRYPDLQVERIGLDDIMVFMNRGETTCAD